MSITYSSVAMTIINKCNFISYGFMPLSWLIFKPNDNNTLIYLCLYLKVFSQRILEDKINTVFHFQYYILETGLRVIGRKQKFSNMISPLCSLLQDAQGVLWSQLKLDSRFKKLPEGYTDKHEDCVITRSIISRNK